MKPVSPVYDSAADRWGISEITFAKDQPQYLPLPALIFQDGLVVTRWSLSWKERIQLLFGGSVFLGLLTFNSPLQPVIIATNIDDVL